MLHISPISRPDRFLNEDMPFVNTAGTMNFNLTSPELLDLASYQRTLRQLISVLAASSVNLSNRASDAASVSASPAPVRGGTTEIVLGSGGCFILDTSVTDPGFEDYLIDGDRAGTATSRGDGLDAPRLSSTQSYPLAFIATSQLPSLRSSSSNGNTTNPTASTSTSAPVLYFLRLPLNPFTHGIQCQLSARRLCAKHVSLLDRILRRLCDASPGAFMVGYSDGISGVDAGVEVVYSGENSRYQAQPSKPQQQQGQGQQGHPYEEHHQQHQHFQQQGVLSSTPQAGVNLEQSVAAARDRGDMELDSRVAGLVGHVEHPTTPTSNLTEERKHLNSPPMPSSAKSAKALKNEHGMTVEATAPVAKSNTSTAELTVQDDSNDSHLLLSEGTVEAGLLNYDFGFSDDLDQLMDVHGAIDIDQLHDMLWVN